MSFPLSPFNQGTLCGNIAVSLQEISPPKRPSLQDVFTRVDHLYRLCNIYPGNVKEIGQCSLLLKNGGLLDDADKECQRVLISHALTSQKKSKEHTETKSNEIAINLCQALNARQQPLPTLADLANGISNLTKISGLLISNFTPLVHCLVDLYPVEERSAKDHEAFNLVKRLSTYGHFDSLLPKFQKLQISYQKSEEWKEEVRYVRKSGHLSAEEIAEKVFQIDTFSSAGDFEKLKILQIFLNGLLTEKRIYSSLQNLRKQLQDFYPNDQLFVDRKDQVKEFHLAMSRSIHAFVHLQKPQHQKKMFDYFTDINSQVEKVDAMCKMDLSMTVQTAHERLQRSLTKVSKLRRKIETSLPLDDIPQDIWEAFAEKVIRGAIDYRVFLWQVIDVIYQISSQCRDIFTLQDCDRRLIKCALPALSSVYQKFTVHYFEFLRGGNRQTWEYVTEIDQIAELINATSENRSEIYQVFHKQLIDRLPLNGQSKRRALQYTTIFINDKDRGGVLPPTLFHKQKTSSPKAKQPSSSTELLTVPTKGMAQRAVIDTENVSPLVVWSRLKIELENWRSPFTYHPRVKRWFSAHVPLDPTNFPEYRQQSRSHQNLMIQLHRLVPLADFFCHRGWIESSFSDRGELIKRFILPAEIKTDENLQRGLIVWAVNARNMCYHRFFHREMKSVDITESLRVSFEQTQTIPNITEKTSLGILEFNDCRDESAEIDHLTETVTLKDIKAPNLVLRLKFMSQNETN